MRRGGLLVLATAMLSCVSLGRAHAGEETADVLPPTDLAISQIAYGDTGTVVVEWKNAEDYDLVEIIVGGGEATFVLGSESSVTLEQIAVEAQEIRVSGWVEETTSSPAIEIFDVLAASPVTEPVVDIECSFVARRGGRIEITWSLGASEWSRGVASIVGSPKSVDITAGISFEAGTTALVVEDLGLEPRAIEIRFANDGDYFSEPLAPSCPLRVPNFIRGDCDDDGRVSITDAIFELDHLFRGGERWYCDDACDVNDDGGTNLSDPISILNTLFLGAQEGGLVLFGDCVADATEDFLGGLCGCP
jgi:hypothetical protein